MALGLLMKPIDSSAMAPRELSGDHFVQIFQPVRLAGTSRSKSWKVEKVEEVSLVNFSTITWDSNPHVSL